MGRGGSGKTDESLKKKSPWLHAWHDPVGGFSAMDGGVRLVDLVGDGDHRLLVADMTQALIVYKGTQRVQEVPLMDPPVALSTFYADRAVPRTPLIAVASGSHVYIYRNLKPYFKFFLPAVDIDVQETRIWDDVRSGDKDAEQAYLALASARDDGVRLSSLSMDFLALQDAKEMTEFIKSRASEPHVQHTVVTCMDTLKKDSDDDDAVSCLVLGTENRQLLILDPKGSSVLTKTKLAGIPTMMAVSGIFDADWRIMVACRDAKIYSIKGGETRGTAVLLGQVIELESHPCGMARVDKSLIVGTMDQRILSYSIRAKKEFALSPLPAPILAIEPLVVTRNRVMSAYIVALKNGEIRVYRESTLLDTININAEVSAMRFGKFGREDNALVCVHRSGAITVKMLHRNAFSEPTSATSGPPPEQDVPLAVPKKTRLFVEQTQREREQAVDMHRVFQRDLGRLRLNTARTYVKMITEGHDLGVSRVGGGASLRINAQVLGLGPIFKLLIDLLNEGTRPLQGVPLALVYDRALYELSDGFTSLVIVPSLLPGLSTRVEVEMRSIDANGAADAVRILVLNKKSCLPLVSAMVNMPVSEIDQE